MKFILPIITLLLFTITSTGQNVNLTEMIKLNNLGIEEFDTSVTRKGFTYKETQKNDSAESTVYKNGKGRNTSYITKAIYKTDNWEMVSYQTNDESTYLKFKTELKNLGFNYVGKNVSDDDTIMFYYKKDNLKLTLSSWLNKAEEKYTVYEISIIKDKD